MDIVLIVGFSQGFSRTMVGIGFERRMREGVSALMETVSGQTIKGDSVLMFL